MALAIASTLSRSVVSTSRGGEGLPKSFELGASLQPVFDYPRPLFTKRTQWASYGVEGIGVGFQQWSVTGSKARKEDHVRTVAIGHAIFRPG